MTISEGAYMSLSDSSLYDQQPPSSFWGWESALSCKPRPRRLAPPERQVRTELKGAGACLKALPQIKGFPFTVNLAHFTS